MAAIEKITTMLMFMGRAEEAIRFYTTLFDDSRVESIQHYGPDFPGPEGQVAHARFRLKGQLLLATDSHVGKQPFTFTPSMSFFVSCEDEAEVDRLFAALSEGGNVLMSLSDDYQFARKYAFVQDRFGVSWQLMLA